MFESPLKCVGESLMSDIMAKDARGGWKSLITQKTSSYKQTSCSSWPLLLSFHIHSI